MRCELNDVDEVKNNKYVFTHHTRGWKFFHSREGCTSEELLEGTSYVKRSPCFDGSKGDADKAEE